MTFRFIGQFQPKVSSMLYDCVYCCSITTAVPRSSQTHFQLFYVDSSGDWYTQHQDVSKNVSYRSIKSSCIDDDDDDYEIAEKAAAVMKFQNTDMGASTTRRLLGWSILTILLETLMEL